MARNFSNPQSHPKCPTRANSKMTSIPSGRYCVMQTVLVFNFPAINMHLVSFLHQGIQRAKGRLPLNTDCPSSNGQEHFSYGNHQGNSPYLAQRNHLAVACNQLEFPSTDINHSGATVGGKQIIQNSQLYSKLVFFFAFLFIFPVTQENEVKSLLHMVKPRH